jgi:glucokinase
VGAHFGCPVHIGNDANLAALGEWRYGAGRGVDNMIYLTVSTGIGGGVIAHGRLLTGAHGLAAELGHMAVEPDGPACGCGRHGHLEAVASGIAIARRAAERLAEGQASALAEIVPPGRGPTAEDVNQAAQQGDRLAVELLNEAGAVIGRHLASLAHAFNPQRFVIGGGVTQAGRFLFEPMERALRDHIMHPVFLEDLALLPAALGDDAGLVGAMVLASEA